MSAFDLSLPCTIMEQSQSFHGGAVQIWRNFLFNLTCRTQHASRKHYHRTFYHSTHTPGDFLFNVYKLKLNFENQIRFEKENVTSHSPYNYLLLLLAFSSFQGLLCFLMPCSVQPTILFDQKRLYDLQQITKKEKNLSIGLPELVHSIENLPWFALCLLADLECQSEGWSLDEGITLMVRYKGIRRREWWGYSDPRPNVATVG